jgi:hypothetical protein
MLPIFQRTVTNSSGDVLPGASVEVRRESDNALVQLYADRAGTVLLPNPTTADSDGFVQFFAASSNYKITATSGAGTVVWRYVDIGSADVRSDLSVSTGAAMVGFEWAVLPAAIGKVNWGIQSAGNRVNVMRYIPPAEWPGIIARTSLYDCTSAINTALSTGPTWLPDGLFNTSAPVVIGRFPLLGAGVTYSSPYGTSSINGAVIKPTGLQNAAAVAITGIATANKVKTGGFGIDMSAMTAGTLSGDFDVSGMTKGVYVENRHDTSLFDIEVFAVPANSAAFVFHSVQPGGGLYWGKHDKLASRTKLATGNDPTAKGFVLLGTGDSLTAQCFTDCTSYRGWYLKNVNNCQFYSCHSENAPKDGVYIDGGGQLTFIGGFYEGQGNEDTTRLYRQFYGTNNPKRVTLIGQSFSGNGTEGLLAENGFVRINAGGASADEKRQIVGGMVVDEAGNVGAPGNTAILAYLSNFNSTVPTATERVIFFNTATAGFDVAGEYNSGSGNLQFRTPGSSFGGLKGVYCVQVHLRIQKSGGGAIPAGTIIEFRLGGGGYVGPSAAKMVASGQANEFLTASILLRVNGSSTAFISPRLYHNAGSDLLIVNSNGAVSDSWINVSKVA